MCGGCVCMFVYVCGYFCMPKQIWVWEREIGIGLLSSFYSLKQGLWLNLELSDFTSSASHFPWRSPVTAYLVLVLLEGCHAHPECTWCRGSDFQSFGLLCKRFIHSTISPGPGLSCIIIVVDIVLYLAALMVFLGFVLWTPLHWDSKIHFSPLTTHNPGLHVAP